MHVISPLESMFRTGAGVFAVDQEQRIIFWNQGAQAILGYVPEDVIGKLCFEAIRGLDESGQAGCGASCHIADCGSEGEMGSGRNLQAKAKDGSSHWLSMVCTFIDSADNGLAAVVHIFRDVTPEVEAKKLVERIADQISGLDLFQRRDEGAPGPEIELTERENQVLVLLAQGDGTERIARKLTISNSTARNHIQNVLTKLGVHTRLEAVAYALRHKVIETAWLGEE